MLNIVFVFGIYLEKVPEKLGHVTRENYDFMGYFNSCIYKSRSIQQFQDK